MVKNRQETMVHSANDENGSTPHAKLIYSISISTLCFHRPHSPPTIQPSLPRVGNIRHKIPLSHISSTLQHHYQASPLGSCFSHCIGAQGKIPSKCICSSRLIADYCIWRTFRNLPFCVSGYGFIDTQSEVIKLSLFSKETAKFCCLLIYRNSQYF